MADDNNGGDGGANETQEALQEQYDVDPDTFAEYWGIDTDSAELTPTDTDQNNQ